MEAIETAGRELLYRASQNRSVFFTYLDLSGAGRHHCTCADWAEPRFRGVLRARGGMFCRHIAAAALRGGNGHLLLPVLTWRRSWT